MNEQKRAPRRAAQHDEASVETEAIEVPVVGETVEILPARLETAQVVRQASPAIVDDVFPDFAISLEEANRRVEMLREFVRGHMVEGEDYGVIPGASPKPTLFKPGAEKLNAIFGLAPVVEISSRVEDWDASFVAYEIKVTLLNKRTGAIEAEGIGNCNSRERRYKSQDAANIANTILKMAKKRALIDATLSATRASGIFTQDLEDMELGGRSSNASRTSSHDAPRSSYAGQNGERSSGGFARGGNGANAANGGNAANGANGGNAAQNGGQSGGANGPSSAVLTEAQRGAILAMANKAFGRNVNEEMARLVDKPIAQLSKSEASSIIDHLRSLLPEQAPRENREGFQRSGPRN